MRVRCCIFKEYHVLSSLSYIVNRNGYFNLLLQNQKEAEEMKQLGNKRLNFTTCARTLGVGPRWKRFVLRPGFANFLGLQVKIKDETDDEENERKNTSRGAVQARWPLKPKQCRCHFCCGDFGVDPQISAAKMQTLFLNLKKQCRCNLCCDIEPRACQKSVA